MAECEKTWELTIVGYFLEKKMALGPISYRAMSMWAIFGLKEVRAHDEGFFFFAFDNKNGTDNVLKDGPWKLYNKFI